MEYNIKNMNIIENGQILPESEFGKNINIIISKYKPKNIVEIGTWKGLGSTYSVITSLIENKYKANFISLETNNNFYEIAKNNLEGYLEYVTLILGRIIEVEEIENFVSTLSLDNQHQHWLKEDLTNYNLCPNVFSHIPNSIDLLILDGGEFSTYGEWKVLKDRSKIIMLDDTNMIKCKRIVEESLQHGNYKTLFSSNERNGFHVFENTTL